MNIVISGLKKQELAKHIRQHYRKDFTIVKSKPQFVLCYGGDGTLLFAEREFPGVPKVMIRQSRVCNTCARLTRDTILKLLADGHYSLVEHSLLEVKAKGKVLYGLNDVLVSHAAPNSGLRFRVWLNGNQYGGELLGDGLLVATPLGSTGYYQSITRSTFQQGIGIAFNNSVFTIDHLVVPDGASVKIKIDRGPATVAVDNYDKYIQLQSGDVATIQQSHRTTSMVYFPGKEYRLFNLGIGETRVPLGFCQMCNKPLPQA